MSRHYLTLGGKRYYAHGFGGVETKQGWFTDDNGNRCYAGVDGEIKEGFVKINDSTYYTNQYGVRQVGYFEAYNGYRYYANENGNVITLSCTFANNKGQWCIAGENGVISEGFVTYFYDTYYTDEFGVPQKGIFAVGNDYYFASPSGFVNFNEGYFYTTDGRYYASIGGVICMEEGFYYRSDNKLIYVHEGGKIYSAFLIDEEKHETYYCNDEGVMARNGYFTAYYSGNRYYAYSDYRIIDKKGWHYREDGVKIYTFEGGVILTGFTNIDGQRYFIDEYGRAYLT